MYNELYGVITELYGVINALQASLLRLPFTSRLRASWTSIQYLPVWYATRTITLRGVVYFVPAMFCSLSTSFLHRVARQHYDSVFRVEFVFVFRHFINCSLSSMDITSEIWIQGFFSDQECKGHGYYILTMWRNVTKCRPCIDRWPNTHEHSQRDGNSYTHVIAN